MVIISDEKTKFPITKVTLYKHGAAFIQHEGEVDDDEEVELFFKLKDMNDVLKTFTATDCSGNGMITEVKYEGSKTHLLSESTTNYWLSGGLLSQQALGAEISIVVSVASTVSTSQVTSNNLVSASQVESDNNSSLKVVRGKLLGIEKIEGVSPSEPSNNNKRNVQLVLLVGGTTLQHFNVSDIQGNLQCVYMDSHTTEIKILDQELLRDINTGLQDSLALKKEHLKRLTVVCRGKGRRKIRVNYMIEAAIWKTTYRMSATSKQNPSSDEKDNWMEGWACIDNMSEYDWDDVKLTLVSGKPLSYFTELYLPKFHFQRASPFNSTTPIPSPYASGFGTSTAPSSFSFGSTSTKSIPTTALFGSTSSSFGGTGSTTTPSFSSTTSSSFGSTATPSFSSTTFGSSTVSAYDTPDNNNYNSDEGDPFSTIDVQTTTTEVGDFFHFELENPVSIPRKSSALVPFIQRSLKGAAKQVSLFTSKYSSVHPLSAILFKNTTEGTLEAGPIAVLNRGKFVGEGMLRTLAPNEEVSIPYSVEMNCTVKRSNAKKTFKPLKFEIKNGDVIITTLVELCTTYTIKNKTKSPLDFVLEHQRKPNHELCDAESNKPTYSNPFIHRFNFMVDDNQTKEFVVKENSKHSGHIPLMSLNKKMIKQWTENKFLDDTLELTLNNLMTACAELLNVSDELESTENSIQETLATQERLRLHIKSTANNTFENALVEKEKELESLMSKRQQLKQTWKANKHRILTQIYEFEHSVDINAAATEVDPTLMDNTLPFGFITGHAKKMHRTVSDVINDPRRQSKQSQQSQPWFGAPVQTPGFGAPTPSRGFAPATQSTPTPSTSVPTFSFGSNRPNSTEKTPTAPPLTADSVEKESAPVSNLKRTASDTATTDTSSTPSSTAALSPATFSFGSATTSPISTATTPSISTSASSGASSSSFTFGFKQSTTATQPPSPFSSTTASVSTSNICSSMPNNTSTGFNTNISTSSSPFSNSSTTPSPSSNNSASSSSGFSFARSNTTTATTGFGFGNANATTTPPSRFWNSSTTSSSSFSHSSSSSSCFGITSTTTPIVQTPFLQTRNTVAAPAPPVTPPVGQRPTSFAPLGTQPRSFTFGQSQQSGFGQQPIRFGQQQTSGFGQQQTRGFGQPSGWGQGSGHAQTTATLQSNPFSRPSLFSTYTTTTVLPSTPVTTTTVPSSTPSTPSTTTPSFSFSAASTASTSTSIASATSATSTASSSTPSTSSSTSSTSSTPSDSNSSTTSS